MKYIIVFTKSKISSIAAFYGMNNRNSRCVKTIEMTNEVLDNYYINDKIKIEPLLNKLSDNFQMILFNQLKMGNLPLKALYIY